MSSLPTSLPIVSSPSTLSPIETLPIEIIEMIFTNVAGDRSIWPDGILHDVRKLFLPLLIIVKGWTAIAEKELYKVIYLEKASVLEKLVQIPERNRRLSYIDEITFSIRLLKQNDIFNLHILLPRLPRLRTLTLYVTPTLWLQISPVLVHVNSLRDLDLSIREEEEEDGEIQSVSLPDIPLLMSLESICLASESGVIENLEDFFENKPRPNLKRLYLNESASADIIPCFDLLPALEHLTLTNCADGELLLNLPPNLKRLDTYSSQELMNDIRSLDGPLHLNHLSILGYANTFDYSILPFIPTLQVLQLNVVKLDLLADSMALISVGGLRFKKLKIRERHNTTAAEALVRMLRVERECKRIGIDFENYEGC